MLSDELKLNNVEEELLVSIYKAMEVFKTFKNSKIKINERTISIEDKKYLALFLGVYYKTNEVSKILHLLRYDYGIEVRTHLLKEEEYMKIYKKNFVDILDNLIEDNTIEEYMLKLLEVDFIKDFYKKRGLNINPVRVLIKSSLEHKKKSSSKILQK